MTVIKINAITVPADSGDELARRFANRAGAVDGQDGFEGFELLARSPQRVRRRYEAKPRIAADDTDIRKLRVSDDDIDVPGFLKD